jgi:hypothetical protein
MAVVTLNRVVAIASLGAVTLLATFAARAQSPAAEPDDASAPIDASAEAASEVDASGAPMTTTIATASDASRHTAATLRPARPGVPAFAIAGGGFGSSDQLNRGYDAWIVAASIGAAVGAVAASTIDVAVFAREPARTPQAIQWGPSLVLRQGGGALGVGGTF